MARYPLVLQICWTSGNLLVGQGQKDKMTKLQKERNNQWQKDKKTKRPSDKTTKRPERDFNIMMSGQFRTHEMFFYATYFLYLKESFWKTEAGTYCINVDFTELGKWDWILNLQVMIKIYVPNSNPATCVEHNAFQLLQ